MYFADEIDIQKEPFIYCQFPGNSNGKSADES